MQYKVLIVDDSKLARMVMASAFRRIRPDWTLVETTNADEALAAVSGGAVDIALIDFNMPGSRWTGIGCKYPQDPSEHAGRRCLGECPE